MSKLLYKYLVNQKVTLSFGKPNESYHLESNAATALDQLLRQKTPSKDLSAFIKEMPEVFLKVSIRNLTDFAKSLVDERSKFDKDISEFMCNFENIDRNETYLRLRDNARGCLHVCPCCKRPCDVDHNQIPSKPGSKDNEHRCLSGHALRAMNGYKFEVNNEASLYTCEQIEDDKVLVIDSIRYQWLQFKNKHQDWIFESNLEEDELIQRRAKNFKIWKKIGPYLCGKYKMDFVMKNTPQEINHPSYHFILLLDASASMFGERWNDLIRAVETFIKSRISMKTNDRLTIIVFADGTETPYENADLHTIEIEKIPFFDHLKTDFLLAFKTLNECLTRSRKNSANTNYAIVFMSDGEGTYPEEEIDLLEKTHADVIKRFWTINLVGADADTNLSSEATQSQKVFDQINEKMNGDMYLLRESSALISTYAEVATAPSRNSR